MSGFLIETDKKSAVPEMEFIGPELASAHKELDRLAKQLDVLPLTSFVSLDEGDQELIKDLAEEGGADVSSFQIEPPTWFDPAQGIKTTQALLKHVSEDMKAFKKGPAFVAELTELAAALETIAKKKGRWRFYYDY